MPEILIGNTRDFIAAYKFDLYIGNPFSIHFFPIDANSLVLTRTNYSDLSQLEKTLQIRNAKILAFGAGSVFDPAKYIAKITSSHLTAIPSALSVNSFATHRSSFFDGKSKKSFETAPADTIVLDYELLKGAGVLNSLGIVELAATATAQADWSSAVAKGVEPDNQPIKGRCLLLVENTMGLLSNAGDISVDLEGLFENLLESGLITQAFGNGRPVSGSGHLVSAYIENEIPCAHGAGLYLGILVAAMLQRKLGKDTTHVRKVASQLQNARVLRDYVRKAFNRAEVQPIIASVHPRDGRYTILDEASPAQLKEATEKVCDIVFS